MKVRIFSEDTPEGAEADWPLIPRVGEVVSFTYRGGTTNMGVLDVRWMADADANLTEVEIRLTYGEVKSE